MAAETVSDYLENGVVRNSVNFPTVAPPERAPNSIRFVVVNKNEPGMLAKITDAISQHNLNITQQINNSRGDVAYNVIDFDASGATDGTVFDAKLLQKEITMLDGVLSSRVLYGVSGTGYAKNVDGNYFA